jgi:hypothetical protein
MNVTERGRGLKNYGDPLRCSYGTTIEVYDSSAAESPHVWLKLEAGNRLPFDAGQGVAHLSEEQARDLRDRLDLWLTRQHFRSKRAGRAQEEKL